MRARRRNVAFGFVLAFVAVSAIAQLQPHVADREQERVKRDVGSILVKRLYGQMAPLTYPERAILYSSQPTRVQIGLWQHHYDEFERLNPRLTPAQREVVGLFRAAAEDVAWWRIHEGDEGWEQKHAQVEALKARGLAAFAVQDFIDGFARLGPPYVPRLGLPDVPAVGTVYCHCSSVSDWCSLDGSVECVPGLDIGMCVPYYGCGTMGMYTCDGLCFG